jgi:hypothetical protein
MHTGKPRHARGLPFSGRNPGPHGRGVNPGLGKMNAGGATLHRWHSTQEGEDMRCKSNNP